MRPSARGHAQHAAAARRIADWVCLRAGLHEAVGVAWAQGAGGLGDGLETYSARHSAMECTREAARVRGNVDAAAEDRADPDWRD